MNAFMVEAMVRQAMSAARRARIRLVFWVAAGAALIVAGIAGAAVTLHAGASEAMTWTLVAFGGATCCAAWGGWALRKLARIERRIVGVVAAAADRSAGPRSKPA